MEITARLTKDALIKKTKDDRAFVTFSMAINDSYKKQGLVEPVKTVLYIDCAYFISTNVATILKKGAIVQVTGRMYLNAYTSMNGEAKANINFHVNTIKLLASGKTENTVQASVPTNDPKDDLPF
jgi:single-strand DNA-binding protein